MNSDITLSYISLKFCRSAKTQWSYYGGPVIGESGIKHLNEIGPKVSHVYEIFNKGPWKVSSFEVRISWPYEVANDKPHGKWLLYLEEMPTVKGNGLQIFLSDRSLNILTGHLISF